MKRIVCGVLVLLALQYSVLADVPKTIFDDDWVPPTRQEVRPPVVVSPPANSGPDTKPADTKPVTPAPTPEVGAPSHQAVAPQPSRISVPTSAAQANAWKVIKGDIYKNDIANATTPAQKVELARKLMTVAEDTKKDPVGKYVLLAQAKELAIVSGDPPTAFKCLDELGKDYDINYPVMKLDLFSALSKTVSVPSDIQEVTEGLNRWADAQIKSDRYDAANKACDIALAVAHKDLDNRLVNSTLQHRKQIVEIRSAYLASKATFASLARKPNDPAANLAIGRFYCFMKGDWDKGLSMLALGNDATLGGLAVKELAGGSGSDAQIAIADGWWGVMENEKGLTQDRIRDHAVKWYTDALPNLEGLVKAKAEKRLSVARNQASDGQSALFPCTLLDHSGNKVVSIELKDNVRATTKENFTPPVEFVIVARTDTTSGNDIRIKYAADQIIFNWAGNPNELRIDGGPANGRHMGGFGRIPVNRWVQIKLQVLTDSLNIYIDGKQRYHTDADFSKIDEPLSISPATGCNVKIGSILAQKPQTQEQ